VSAPGVDPDALEPSRIQLHSLLRLRWAWVLVQVGATAVAAALLGQKVQLFYVALVVVTTVLSNLGALIVQRRAHVPRELLGTVLVALDIMLFTVVLHFTGGPENPFGFLYLVPIALGAYTLAAVRMWLLVGLTLACSAALFWLQPEAPVNEHAHHMMGHAAGVGAYASHLQGMWIALGVAAIFIVGFVGRLSSALRERDAQLGKMRASAERSLRMASLTTLAAGAAHELATPLGTIAVVSKELGRRLKSAQSELEPEAMLIRQEVTRCREILDRLSASVGGEATSKQSLGEVVSSIVDGFPAAERLRITGMDELCDVGVSLPRAAVVTAVRALLQNAVDASELAATVELCLRLDGDSIEMIVTDGGAGMDASTLEHATEPFFTTKPEGRGLGMFLAASVAEQLGGSMQVTSAPGAGTSVRWRIPANIARRC
jgi:two-component system sensor histidine kinase RegB